MFRTALFSILLVAYCAIPARAEVNSGWWVIVGVLPEQNPDPTASERLHKRIARCGLQAFNDWSWKFSGFASGYTVYVLGAYSSKAEAIVTLTSAKKCVPDAYIKQGAYAGE